MPLVTELAGLKQAAEAAPDEHAKSAAACEAATRKPFWMVTTAARSEHSICGEDDVATSVLLDADSRRSLGHIEPESGETA